MTWAPMAEMPAVLWRQSRPLLLFLATRVAVLVSRFILMGPARVPRLDED